MILAKGHKILSKMENNLFCYIMVTHFFIFLVQYCYSPWSRNSDKKLIILLTIFNLIAFCETYFGRNSLQLVVLHHWQGLVRIELNNSIIIV